MRCPARRGYTIQRLFSKYLQEITRTKIIRHYANAFVMAFLMWIDKRRTPKIPVLSLIEWVVLERWFQGKPTDGIHNYERWVLFVTRFTKMCWACWGMLSVRFKVSNYLLWVHTTIKLFENLSISACSGNWSFDNYALYTQQPNGSIFSFSETKRILAFGFHPDRSKLQAWWYRVLSKLSSYIAVQYFCSLRQFFGIF